MLSWACRRFRARFAPGSAHPHRRVCRECEAFAAAVEQAAGARLPLPAGLQNRLREIAAPAAPEAHNVLPFPVPRLPLPGPLAARLRRIAPPASGRRPVPEWIRNPRYAVAASALLALLLGPLLPGAANQGRQAVGAFREEVSPLLDRAEESGKQEITRVRTGAAEAYDAARRSAEASLHRIDAGVSGLSAWLSAFANQESMNQDPRGAAPGSVRRPQ